MLSVQDLDVKQRDQIIEVFKTVRKDMGIDRPKDGKTVRLTGTQIRANQGIERVNLLLASELIEQVGTRGLGGRS